MLLCIFRTSLRGRQPKYFYCTAGLVSCWNVGKKTRERRRFKTSSQIEMVNAFLGLESKSSGLRRSPQSPCRLWICTTEEHPTGLSENPEDQVELKCKKFQ
jgi:hypothetical protein